MVEADHPATSAPAIDLPGPKYETSPSIQLPEGPMFKALASRGVHTVWDLLFGEAGCPIPCTNERILSVTWVTS
jgi:hypothetical protein